MDDPLIITPDKRIEVELEIIPMNLMKQVDFETFEVADYHEKKEQDCYTLKILLM